MKSIANRRLLEQLVRRLAEVSPELPRRWGSITAHQMLVHVADASETILQRRPWALGNRSPSRLMKFLALRAPLRWPQNIKSGAEPGQLELEPGVFEADRNRAIITLRDIAEAGPGGLVDNHPLFGAMSRADWHRWAWLHTDHHLRQFGR